MFWISDSSRFERNTMNPLRGYYTMVQNPTKGELKGGIYKPRLTLSHRFNCSTRHEETLAIELSLPKLIFSNNFDELTIDDYPLITYRLGSILKEMGVMVFKNILDRAPVSLVHYSKNIPLTDGTTPNYIINWIKGANISLALDINQTDYRNAGHGFKWHANSYEVTFYDKIKDLEIARRSDKRAIEEDGTIQLNLFDALQTRKYFEVLRMEVRLNQRRKIGQLFKTLGIDTELAFKNLFSPTISQKVLLYYLNTIESRRPPLLNYTLTTPKTLLADLIVHNPKIRLKKILQSFGLKMALEDLPPHELRSMLGAYSDRSWYRLMAETKGLSLPSNHNPLLAVRQNLLEFKPTRLVDFQEQLLNNDKYN
jgi:hypothetical protein